MESALTRIHRQDDAHFLSEKVSGKFELFVGRKAIFGKAVLTIAARIGQERDYVATRLFRQCALPWPLMVMGSLCDRDETPRNVCAWVRHIGSWKTGSCLPLEVRAANSVSSHGQSLR
jgi:hypothetical protein